MIQIIHNQKTVPLIRIEFNGEPATFTSSAQTINVNVNEEYGFNHLKVYLLEDAKFNIKDVRVADQTVRQTLYMSYIVDNGNMYQPATEMQKAGQIWIMPFIYPISTWISVIDEKFPPNILGTDIINKYKIYFPERIKLNKKFIPVVRDFFEYDFDFVAIEKTEITQFNDPFELYNINIDSESLYKEIYENLDALRVVAGQTLYNMIDDPNFNKADHWFTLNTHRHGKPVIDPTLLPKTFDFLNKFEYEINSATISVTPPGGYAVTHIDKRSPDADIRFRGCKQLYMPLNYPAGAIAKLHRVGVVPLQPVVFNPQYYSHGIVNDSDEHRIVLSIIFNYKHEDWKYL